MSDAVQIAFIVCGAIVALAIILALLYVWKNGEPASAVPPQRFYVPPQRSYYTEHKLDLGGVPEADRARIVSEWLKSQQPKESPRA